MSVGIAFIPAMTPKVGAHAIAVKISMIDATSWLNSGGGVVPVPVPKMIRNTTGTTPRTGTDWNMSSKGKSTWEARGILAFAIQYARAKWSVQMDTIVFLVIVD